MRVNLERHLAKADWKNAAVEASDLCEHLRARGELGEALALARKSVELADRSGVAFERSARRTTLAATLHAMGLREEAAAQFEEAERIQKEWDPEEPMLYSRQGFEYCDLLLDQGREAEVQERAARALEISTRNHWLVDIALDRISLGRAHLLAVQRGAAGDLAQAATYLHHAANSLHGTGIEEIIPLCHLAHGAVLTHLGNFFYARFELQVALSLATRGGLRLLVADAHLGLTRLDFAESTPSSATYDLTAARLIIDATGYHRRDAELAALEASVLAATPPARSPDPPTT